MTDQSTAYDVVEYPGRPLLQTHPGSLAAYGQLLQLNPAAPDRCRVLDLGCGDGANLLGLAAALPESTFVGVELADSAVRAGTELARESGISNVSLQQGDIAALDPKLGTFDYVIAHGVYSWVPAPVRDALLAACARHLAPSGIAFVSYATYPGARQREIVREMMQYHARGAGEPLLRVAQGLDFVRFVRGAQGASPYGGMLEQELKRLGENSPHYVFHDDFSEVHAPVYFREFAAHAAAHGLAFAIESVYGLLPNAGLPAAAYKSIELWSEGDALAREQYLDFTRGTPFRQSLLVHAPGNVRSLGFEERMLSLYVVGDLQPQSGRPDIASRKKERFAPVTRVAQPAETDEPLIKGIFVALAKARPRALRVSELLTEAESLAGLGPVEGEARAARVRAVAGMLLGAAAGRFVTILAAAPRVAFTPYDRPVASGLVRAQARRSPVVTNLCHESVLLNPQVRALVQAADGTRSRDELRIHLAQRGPDGKAALESALFPQAMQLAMKLALFTH